jgi:hypothetical protein
MSEATVFAITPAMGPSFAVPSRDDLRDSVSYWLNAAYLGIGELSLTWPVAAFLRSL